MASGGAFETAALSSSKDVALCRAAYREMRPDASFDRSGMLAIIFVVPFQNGKAKGRVTMADERKDQDENP